MKKTKFLVLFGLAGLSCYAQSDELKRILSQELGPSKVVTYLPSRSQVILSESISIKADGSGNAVITLTNASASPIDNIHSGGGVEPGFNSYPGTLTNVSQSGNTYMLTCVASPQICFSYFLPY